MKRAILAHALIVTATIFAWLTHANAAPPTVVPSPGYDARLQEQRSAGNPTSQPARTSGGSGPVVGRHLKRTHHRAH